MTSQTNTFNLDFAPDRAGFSEARRQLEAAGVDHAELGAIDLALQRFSRSSGNFRISVEQDENGTQKLSGTAVIEFFTTKKPSLSPHIAWGTAVTDIEMSERSREIIAMKGATTLGAVASLSVSDFLSVAKVTTHEIGELRRILKSHGLRFGMTERPEA